MVVAGLGSVHIYYYVHNLNHAGRTRFISRSIHMTSHQLTPTAMEMMAVMIVMALTNQCAPMESTAIGKP